MKRPKLTSRIQLRCTPGEHKCINEFAANLELTTTNFIRDCVILSVAHNLNRKQWDRQVARSMLMLANQSRVNN